MKIATKIFCLIISLFVLQRAFSADYLSKQLSIKEGLSQVSVMATIKDHKGYMWFGTRNGLNRYNGYEFETYSNIPGDSTSLVNNFVYSLLEDADQNLWVGTEGGVCVYNTKMNAFRRYTSRDSDSTSLIHNTVVELFQDRKKRIWLGTAQGLCFYDVAKNAFVQIPDNQDLSRSSLFKRYSVLSIGD